MDDMNRSMAVYRLEKAKTDLRSARSSLENGFYETSANRSCYAIFHAARAVLVADGQSFSKHSGVIAFFNRDYIKSGILERKFGRILRDAFEIRTDCYYEDFFVISKEEVERQVENAEYFVGRIEAYLGERLGE